MYDIVFILDCSKDIIYNTFVIKHAFSFFLFFYKAYLLYKYIMKSLAEYIIEKREKAGLSVTG